VTTTAAVDTAPNAAFGAGSATPGESSLTSPVIAIPTAPVGGTNPGVRLTFRNNYNTEPTFDGGVLEISINGGPFADVLAAGGTFIEGGYSGSIVNTDSTLTGRQAWTGNSLGFITTTVNLPPASYGQNAQLRWRTAYDTGTNPTGGGMRVDTISIYASTRFCCSGACTFTCPANITVSNDPGVCGAVVTYVTPTETGNCGGTITSDHPSGETFPVGTTTVTLTDTKLDGTTATCSFTVTVNDTEDPTLDAITVAQTVLPQNNHNLVNVGLSGGAFNDNCPGSTRQVFVFGDEDDETPTAPNEVFSPDAKNIGFGTLRLRSERVNSEDGRVYLIIVKVNDPAGNVAFRVATVVVPKSNSQASQNAVDAQATAARNFALANGGTPPPGYLVIGDGPIIGPKQ
jgi:hypothetical protein